MPNLLTQLRESAETYLDQLRQPLEGQGYTVSTQIVMGEAAQSILDVAASADLIAMTTHGRAGFVRWALGSVAERVLQRSVCPVLLWCASRLALWMVACNKFWYRWMDPHLPSKRCQMLRRWPRGTAPACC